jgi:hypothetical protein
MGLGDPSQITLIVPGVLRNTPTAYTETTRTSDFCCQPLVLSPVSPTPSPEGIKQIKHRGGYGRGRFLKKVLDRVGFR